MKSGTEPAHKLLEYLITRALVSKKPKGSEIRLYYPDLCAAMGVPGANDVDLVITIDMKWDEPIDFLEDEPMETTEEIDDPTDS